MSDDHREVRSRLKADMRTLNFELWRFMPANRSEPDAGDEIAGGLLVTLSRLRLGGLGRR